MWDAIIVGAGPAGSVLSSLLARKGRRVLLLDAATFPREKLCGEYIGPGCLKILEPLGVLDDVRRTAYPIYGMRIRSLDGTVFTARFPDGQHGLAIRRSRLDNLLVEDAKRRFVDCRLGIRVDRLLLEDGKVLGVEASSRDKCSEVFRARLTIGADGRNSVVARHLGVFQSHRSHRKAALCVHYEGIDSPSGFAEVHLGRSGYGILNPLGDGTANVSLVIDCGELFAAKGQLDDYFAHALALLPGLGRRLKDARPAEKVRALGPLAQRAVRPSAAGALLVGDAAGFYDPFTGEGVLMALQGAQLAAGLIDRALDSNDFSSRFLKQYDTIRAREFDNRYRFEALIQAIIGRPSLANLTSRKFKAGEKAAEILMAVIGGLARPGALASLRFLGNFV